MPAKKNQSEQRIREFQATVAKQMAYHNISKSELTEAMNMGRTSLWAKLKNPDTLRVNELRHLYDILNFSHEERQLIL